MNRTLFLALTAGACVVSSSAFAQTTGFYGLGFSREETDFGPGNIEDNEFSLSGGATVPLSGQLVLMLDGSYFDSDEGDSEEIGATAHLVNRSDTQAFGAFVGLADVDDETAYAVGGEYARFFSNTTLALGAGYSKIDDADVDLYGVNAEYRIFGSDNLRFDLGLGWNTQESPVAEGDLLSGGAGVEYRFSGSPFSVGARYVYTEADDFDASTNTYAITLRVDFGNASLKDRDRKGNTFGRLGGLGGALSSF